MNQHVGKTIESIELYGLKSYDDEPIVKILFTDNTEFILQATYGGYTGESEDEYPCFINEGVSKYSDAEPYLIYKFTGVINDRANKENISIQ